MTWWSAAPGVRVDVVVVELDVLRHGPAAIRCELVDKGDHAFPPLLDVDVFGTGTGLHRRPGGGLGHRDGFGVVLCVNGEAVIGAKPEGNLDGVFAR